MKRTFTCDQCGGTFPRAWSDDEATAEARDVFGRDPETDPTMAVVCDDCYQAIMAALGHEDKGTPQ